MREAANRLPDECVKGTGLSGDASDCRPLVGFGASLMWSLELSRPRQDESHLLCTRSSASQALIGFPRRCHALHLRLTPKDRLTVYTPTSNTAKGKVKFRSQR